MIRMPLLAAAALIAAISLTIPAQAYEGPEERALDQSLSQMEKQDNAELNTQSLNTAPMRAIPTTPGQQMMLDSNEVATVKSPPVPVQPKAEGPQEMMLDSALDTRTVQ